MPPRENIVIRLGEFDCPPVLTMNLSLESSQFPCPLVFKGEGKQFSNASTNDGIYFHHLPLLIALPDASEARERVSERRDYHFHFNSGTPEDSGSRYGRYLSLRFDFLSYNAGTADLVIGSPAARPDLFVWSAGHGHHHLKDFNEFLLFDAAGNLATTGYKQAFCAIDIERISPTASASPQFNDCNSDQGISAGWADVYSSFLACQFVVIDGVPNGDYTLQSTTNAKEAYDFPE